MDTGPMIEERKEYTTRPHHTSPGCRRAGSVCSTAELYCRGDSTALRLSPDPLVLATGAEINLQVLLTLLEPLPVGAKIKVNMQKDGLINIPIPCINVGEISIGTCEYDGQELLDLAGEFLCPTYVPEGQACTLPLGPGQYGGQEPISIVLPELPSLIIDLLASGTYELKITALLADGSEMTCIQAKVDLTGH